MDTQRARLHPTAGVMTRHAGVGWSALAAFVALVVLAGCGSTSSTDRSATPPTPPTADAGSVVGADTSCPGAGSMSDVAAPFTSSEPEPAVVYLPACYDTDPTRRFPVLYLLHGASADESQWPDVGIAAAADSLIGAGAIGPLVIVMPDGGPSMPDDLVDGLTDQLLPWTDRTYRTIAEGPGRAVGGISRGGRIALFAAAQHPDLFTAVGGHSPAVMKDDATGAVVAGLARFGGKVEIDVGDLDPLRGDVEDFAASATPGTPVNVWPGGHDRRYWADHVPDDLLFYGRRLVTAAATPPR